MTDLACVLVMCVALGWLTGESVGVRSRLRRSHTFAACLVIAALIILLARRPIP